MTGHTPPPDSLRFTLPSRQRRSLLPLAAIFGVLAVLGFLLPGEKNLEQIALTGLFAAACALCFLSYFLHNRDYTELDARGIQALRTGISRKSWSWPDIQEIYLEESVIQGSSSHYVVVLTRNGRRSRLTAPIDHAASMTNDTFAIEAYRLVHFWQQHTGRPLGAPKTVLRTYKWWGGYRDRVIQPGSPG